MTKQWITLFLVGICFCSVMLSACADDVTDIKLQALSTGRELPRVGSKARVTVFLTEDERKNAWPGHSLTFIIKIDRRSVDYDVHLLECKQSSPAIEGVTLSTPIESSDRDTLEKSYTFRAAIREGAEAGIYRIKLSYRAEKVTNARDDRPEEASGEILIPVETAESNHLKVDAIPTSLEIRRGKAQLNCSVKNTSTSYTFSNISLETETEDEYKLSLASIDTLGPLSQPLKVTVTPVYIATPLDLVFPPPALKFRIKYHDGLIYHRSDVFKIDVVDHRPIRMMWTVLSACLGAIFGIKMRLMWLERNKTETPPNQQTTKPDERIEDPNLAVVGAPSTPSDTAISGGTPHAKG